jgi:glycosyltransferase involved in cell wall biosynthesis
MKIVLDLRTIHNLESGDGQFSSNLIREVAFLDRANKYVLLTRGPNKDLFKINASNFDLISEDIPPYSIKERFGLAKVVKGINPDIYHTLTFSFPRGINCRSIISVYDLTHLVYPQFFSFRLNLYYKFVVASCTRKAEAILTISENSKADIINKFNLNSKKVEVIYCGVNPVYKKIDTKSARNYIKEKLSISEKFMLYVGQIKRHKNLESALDAFRKIIDKGVNIKFVLCGRKILEAGWLSNKIREDGLTNRVMLIDAPSDIDLLNFYNAAEVFIYPSLYEGFGLPPLEAMACGLPVVSSNSASLPEVLGDAAILINPLDIDRIAKSLEDILLNKDKADYFSQKGQERSRLFSWEKSARALLKLYEYVYQSAN